MPRDIVLASGSQIRASLFRAAAVDVVAQPARIDETTIRAALAAEGASPRDTADTLAEMKARKISERRPDALVIGCDQILEHRGEMLGKPATLDTARAQLMRLRGDRHTLLAAAVIYVDAEPVWRHVGVARLAMHRFSDAYLDAYLARNWPGIGDSVGGYKLEEEGVRLFARIEGDHFTILGLPLLEILSYLRLRGEIVA